MTPDTAALTDDERAVLCDLLKYFSWDQLAQMGKAVGAVVNRQHGEVTVCVRDGHVSFLRKATFERFVNS